MPRPRHALVLAAGLGTRLRPLTYVRAKPAIPVAGEPMVRRIVRWLAGHGVTDVVVNLHHLPHTLTTIIGDGSDLFVRARYSWEQPQVLGSAGGPHQALPIIGAETFFIVNGDTLTDVDLGRLATAHDSSEALVTLALVPNHDQTRYGGVRLDDSGSVVGFTPRGVLLPSYHFVGVQVASAEAFRPMPAGVAMNSIGGVYDDLIRSRPGSIRGFVCDARFWDVGTTSDYWATSLAFMRAENSSAPMYGRNVHVDRSAHVTRSIFWDDVDVGAGAVVEDCIVTDGIRIPPGSMHRGAVLVRPAGTDELIVTKRDD